jgi:hypothetical protein
LTQHIFINAFIWRERRETKGKLVGTNGHGFDFVFSSYKDCTGSSPWAKDRVSCGFVFHSVAPWFERWSFIASRVVFTVFEYFVLSIIKKGVFATVDIRVNSQDWMVKELSISAMADDGGNVYDDKYDKYDRRCKLIILPSLDPQHSANP